MRMYTRTALLTHVCLILVKVLQRVHYMKYCTRAWARGKYSTRRSQMLYLASTPRPSAIFHVMHERMRYFNWFIVFLNFCAVLELMCRVLCVSSAFWKWNSGRRILLNKLSPLAFCVLGYGILSRNITRILTLEWAIGLAMATTMTL